jgi:hypothetical protein
MERGPNAFEDIPRSRSQVLVLENPEFAQLFHNHPSLKSSRPSFFTLGTTLDNKALRRSTCTGLRFMISVHFLADKPRPPILSMGGAMSMSDAWAGNPHSAGSTGSRARFRGSVLSYLIGF